MLTFADDRGAIRDRSRYTSSDADDHSGHVPVHACIELGICSSKNGYALRAEAHGTEHNRNLASSDLVPLWRTGQTILTRVNGRRRIGLRVFPLRHKDRSRYSDSHPELSGSNFLADGGGNVAFQHSEIQQFGAGIRLKTVRLRRSLSEKIVRLSVWIA